MGVSDAAPPTGIVMRFITRQLVCCTALLGLCGNAHAADTTYPSIVLNDVRHVLTAPGRWQTPEWRNAGLATLGVIGVAAIADRPIRDEMRRHSGNSRLMRDVERFGAEYSLGVLGGFYLAGTLGDDARASAVAQDGLAASLVASGIVTPALKYVTGRSRPRDTSGTTRLRPFSGAASFPSGHTTQAFAIASVIASHYDETWVKCSSYAVAGLVGVARSYHDAHFASDVLAGALIGTLVGQSVVTHNRTLRAGKLAVLPDLAPDRIGVRLARNF